ncbi:MAG: hypothetical protein BWY72_00858 [Bacteroidetes bacterium ADurb.Bin416]|nr:MAG: hypothetical protein BWY72_00858 [Bacteroidetes bacterium ADurb.Bin416]
MQGGIVARTGVRLSNGRQVMAGSMTAQFRLLAVPDAQRFSACRLLLTEGITKHVQEIVRIGLGQPIDKLITVFDKLGLVLVSVHFQ